MKYLILVCSIFTIAQVSEAQNIHAGWPKSQVVDSLHAYRIHFTDAKLSDGHFASTITADSFPYEQGWGALYVDFTASDTAAMVTLSLSSKTEADYSSMCTSWETGLGAGAKNTFQGLVTESWMTNGEAVSLNFSEDHRQIGIVRMDPALFPKPSASDHTEDMLAAYKQGDFEKARSLAEPAAKAGNPQGDFILGMLFVRGKAEEQSDEKAAHYFQQASDSGMLFATYLLSGMYQRGRGVKQDTSHALALLKVAAANGLPMAQTDLAQDYYNGTLVMQDFAKSFALFKSAAESEIPDALFQVGYMMFQGQGTLTDQKGGIGWFERAVEAKSTRAMGFLVPIYMDSSIVPKDMAKAYAYSHLAAKYDPIQAATSGVKVTEKYATNADVEAAKKIMYDLEMKWRD